MPIITRSTPAGCIIMLTGLAALGYGGLAGYAMWKINHATDPAKFQDLLHTLTWHCGISLALGVGLLIMGWRISRTVHHFAMDDLD